MDYHKGYRRTDKSDEHTFYHKGRPDKKVRSTDVFHDIYLFLANLDSHRHGIADKEDADRQQDQYDSAGSIEYQEINVDAVISE